MAVPNYNYYFGSLQSERLKAGSFSAVIYGFDGNDTIFGAASEDLIIGGLGNDLLKGGDGGDTYFVTGSIWQDAFQGYDTYYDNGLTGVDRIVAVGPDVLVSAPPTFPIHAWNLAPPSADGTFYDDQVDLGVTSFRPSNGIDVIDTSHVAIASIVGDENGSRLDFSAVTIISHSVDEEGFHFNTNVAFDGAGGDDTIIGTTTEDVLIGGAGNDRLDGRNGGDSYIVSGHFGDSSFEGFDRYVDTGVGGFDRIMASDDGERVDIGMRTFGFSSGIETIDGSMNEAGVRLLGDDAANALCFASVAFVGGNIVIDGGAGDDSIWGTSGDDTIIGGLGNDVLKGGDGSDTYLVGLKDDWDHDSYDTFIDTGTSGTDQIVLVEGSFAIRVNNLTASSGIEVIDVASAEGDAEINGNDGDNRIDLSGITVIGTLAEISGGGGNDTIFGTSGDDVISGGDGNDVLTGGAGADVFAFWGSSLAAAGLDRVMDFQSGIDQIWLDSSLFQFSSPDVSDVFHYGTKAASPLDQLIYNEAAGKLYYDVDGSGGQSAILIAKLGEGTHLSAADVALF